jgi:hypothetical protein
MAGWGALGVLEQAPLSMLAMLAWEMAVGQHLAALSVLGELGCRHGDIRLAQCLALHRVSVALHFLGGGGLLCGAHVLTKEVPAPSHLAHPLLFLPAHLFSLCPGCSSLPACLPVLQPGTHVQARDSRLLPAGPV